MDYEKEYKEARDRAIKIIIKSRALSTEANLAVSYALSYVFPTTAESEDEDERIRKALVAYFSDTGCDTIQGIRIKKVLAYPEKQKDKVVKFDHDTEQKPAEWSEEDEEALRELLNILSRRELDISDDSEWLSFKLKNWRKSLRPQPSGNFAISFMNYLDEHRPDGKMCLSNGECADIETAFKKEDWAKVIRYVNKYQPHWKPSEEQLSILGKVFAGCELNTTERDSMVDLFNNLKQML